MLLYDMGMSENIETKPEVIAPKKKKRVSFSQYSTFSKCERKWFYDYAKDLREKDDSINTVFGTAIHETVQKYIEILYTNGVEEADALELKKIFKESYDREVDEKLKSKNKPLSDDEYTEFYYNGEDILEDFSKTSNKLKHFPPSKYELIGIELPLEMDIKNEVSFIAFVDVVLKDKMTGKIKIIDFKTSTNGWNKYMKEDNTKIAQLHLYKVFYSRKFNVPMSNIDVEFFILKRNLYENVSFVQSRIQIFNPPNTKMEIVETVSDFSNFVERGFNEDGTFKTDEASFSKNPGTAKKNCKYCIHYKKRCDGKE